MPSLMNVFGGGGRDRTDDIMLAKHTLSQLSYTPSMLLMFGVQYGAGYQNRTDDRRLEICCFTIKLIPHSA
jgi:hypothetical protein